MKKVRFVLRYLGVTGLVALLVVLAACRDDKADDGPETEPQPAVEVEANSQGVLILRGDQPEAMVVAEPVALAAGHRVAVEEQGRVSMRLAGVLTAELFQPGQILFEELFVGEQGVAITLQQEGGVLLADFNPTERREHQLTIQTDTATLTTPGTELLVVQEPQTSLEWVVNLGESGQEIQVSAGGVTQTVRADTARWMSPDAAPSEAISVDQKRLQAWFNSVREEETELTLSEVLMSPANLIATTASLPALPKLNQPVELERSEQGAVKLSLDSEGLFGSPTYVFEDCSGDGAKDIVLRTGTIRLDFRSLKARAMALDVMVINRAESGYGALWGFDAAGTEIAQEPVTVESGQRQTLSLRPAQPLQSAELAMIDGCLMGFSLTPPSEAPEPSRPQAAATPEPQGDVVVNILAEPEQAVGERSQLEALPVGGDSELGSLDIDGELDDWNALSRRSGQSWTSFETITFDEGCSRRYPGSEGNPDLSAQVQFAYDDQYLYVAFQVEDDGYVAYSGEGERYFLGDSPQLSLDMDLQGDINNATRSGDDWQVDFLPDPDSPQVALWQLGSLTSRPFDQAQTAVSPTETGYVLEAALPWRAFNVSPEAGARVGLAANVNDSDTPGARAQECIISTAPGRVWNDPTTWGTLHLKPAN